MYNLIQSLNFNKGSGLDVTPLFKEGSKLDPKNRPICSADC